MASDNFMNLFDHNGKVAIASGGNGGIGLGMPRGLDEGSEAVDATPSSRSADPGSPMVPSMRSTLPLVRNNHGPQTDSEETEATPPKRSNRKRVILAVALLIAGIGAAKVARTWWTVGRFIESTDDAYVGGDVTVIAPKVAGFISKLEVRDNQEIHAGDLLLKLDERDYVAALAKAEAAVAMEKAALTNLAATRQLQEAVIAQANATIEATEAEIVRTRDDQARFSRLLRDRAVSVQESQKADADYKEAIAEGEKSRAALTAAQRQLIVIDSQTQQANASLEQAMAERDLARLNLSYTELRAPIDGTVGNRSAQVGAYATTGSQLLSLVPSRGLWIDANFKESQLARIHPGSTAVVKVDSIPGRAFRGHVISVAPATGAQFSVLPPENATGNFTKIVQRVAVRIVLDDEAEARSQLRPGLSVIAKVNTLSSEKVGASDLAGL
jgi:membrane fusion protein (multidrug efflux system)